METLKAAAEDLKAGVAKCALMSEELCQDCSVAKSLLGGIQKPVAAICAICYSLQASICYDSFLGH